LEAFEKNLLYWNEATNCKCRRYLSDFMHENDNRFPKKTSEFKGICAEPPLNFASCTNRSLDLITTFNLLFINEDELKKIRPKRYKFAKTVWAGIVNHRAPAEAAEEEVEGSQLALLQNPSSKGKPVSDIAGKSVAAHIPFVSCIPSFSQNPLAHAEDAEEVKGALHALPPIPSYGDEFVSDIADESAGAHVPLTSRIQSPYQNPIGVHIPQVLQGPVLVFQQNIHPNEHAEDKDTGDVHNEDEDNEDELDGSK
jgi:hypothetical protein